MFSNDELETLNNMLNQKCKELEQEVKILEGQKKVLIELVAEMEKRKKD